MKRIDLSNTVRFSIMSQNDDDNAAKALFKRCSRVCNTVNANGGKRFPFTGQVDQSNR